MVNSAGLRLQLLAEYIDPSLLTQNKKETMLTRFHFNLLSETIAATISSDEQVAFLALSPAEKVAVVKEIAETKYYGLEAEIFPKFILALAASHNLVNPETHDLAAIATAVGLTLDLTPITWHRPKPPKLYPELIAKWPEEYAKLGGVAAKIGFAWAENKASYQNAVHEALGLGDWLDFLLGRQIPVEDPTMQLFIMGAGTTLHGARGEWYDADDIQFLRLPAGVDGKSVEDIDWEADLEDRLRRREVARKSASQRREKEVQATKERREAAFAVLENAAGYEAIVDQLSLTTFDKVREILTLNPIGIDTAGGKTWLPAAVMKKFEAVYPIANPEMLEFVEQFVIAQVNKRLPNWFNETQDGSLKIRRAPKSERPVGLDRPTRALHLHLDKLITKHTVEKVGNALLQIAGKQLTWAQLVSLIDMANK